MGLRDYLRVLRKRWRWLAVCVVLGVGVAVALTFAATPKYQATAQLFVASGEINTTGELAQGSTFAQNRVKSYVQVISSDLVLDDVGKTLGIPAGQLAGQVKASAPTDTVLIDVTATDTSPDRAALIANTVADRFPAVARSIEPARADSSPTVTVTVIERATVPGSPVSPRLDLNIGLGLLVGALLGLALMAVRQALDTRLKNEDDVGAVTALPVLGRIPFDDKAKTRPLVVTADPQSPQAEAYRQLRTNLQFIAGAGGRGSFLVTSSVPGEGKSASAVNLALSLAESGSRVCLVEADLRRPGIGQYLDLEGAVGLTTVLIGAVDIDDAVQPWGSSGLHVLMSGDRPPNPSEMLGSPAMADLLESLQDRYDIVVIDGAPLLPVTDSAVLARLCTGVVLIVGAGAVRRRELARSISDLESVGAPVSGVLLTRLPTRGPDGTGMKSYTYETAPVARAKQSRRERSDRKAGATAAPTTPTAARPVAAEERREHPALQP